MKITFSKDALGGEAPELVLEKLVGWTFHVTLDEREPYEFDGELYKVAPDGILFFHTTTQTVEVVGRDRVARLEVL